MKKLILATNIALNIVNIILIIETVFLMKNHQHIKTIIAILTLMLIRLHFIEQKLSK